MLIKHIKLILFYYDIWFYKIFLKSKTNKLSPYCPYNYKIILENKNNNLIHPKTIYYLILHKYTDKKLEYIREEITKYIYYRFFKVN
jgi:hypothetical protein